MLDITCKKCSGQFSWENDYDFQDYGLKGEGVISKMFCPNGEDYILYIQTIRELTAAELEGWS